MNKPELLMPAGNLEILKIAFNYGADAVYIGGAAFGLRAKANNFSLEEMKEGIDYAHSLGKRVFITVNIFAHNYDLEGIKEYFKSLAEIKPDAFIISDPGVICLAKQYAPDVEIHLSTQANNTNYLSFNFWWNQGVKRVVTARECSLEEIAEIRRNIPEEMEIENFVHGAMCISYSGRCLLSNYFTGRGANQGLCTHPCRWKYSLMEEKRPGEYLPVFEDERGTYIFNSKDLCMVEHIPELIKAGVNSFKIEGRMKTGLYVATVTRAYRKAIDDYYENPDKYYENLEWYKREIGKCTNRLFTTGFYFGKPSEKDQIYDNNTYNNDYIYLGVVEAVNAEGLLRITQRNKFLTGDTIELMSNNGDNTVALVEGIYDLEMNERESAPHAKEPLWIKLSVNAKAGDILRQEKKGSND